MLGEQIQSAALERQGLAGVYATSALGAMLFRYVSSVAHPGVDEAALALIGLVSIIAAYLLIARAPVEPNMKAAHIIGAAVAAGICFDAVSFLM